MQESYGYDSPGGAMRQRRQQGGGGSNSMQPIGGGAPPSGQQSNYGIGGYRQRQSSGGGGYGAYGSRNGYRQPREQYGGYGLQQPQQQQWNGWNQQSQRPQQWGGGYLGGGQQAPAGSWAASPEGQRQYQAYQQAQYMQRSGAPQQQARDFYQRGAYGGEYGGDQFSGQYFGGWGNAPTYRSNTFNDDARQFGFGGSNMRWDGMVPPQYESRPVNGLSGLYGIRQMQDAQAQQQQPIAVKPVANPDTVPVEPASQPNQQPIAAKPVANQAASEPTEAPPPVEQTTAPADPTLPPPTEPAAGGTSRATIRQKGKK